MSVRPGLRDQLIDEALKAELASLGPDRLLTEGLDQAEAAQRVAGFVRASLQRVLDGLPEANRLDAQAALANRMLEAMDADERLAVPPELLLGVKELAPEHLAGPPELPPRPQVALSASDLLVNGKVSRRSAPS